MSTKVLLFILIPANAPLYYLGWRILFGNMDEFTRCLRYVFTPDIISLFRGRWGEDQWASLKFFLWIGACVGVVYLELHLLAGLTAVDPNLPAEMPPG